MGTNTKKGKEFSRKVKRGIRRSTDLSKLEREVFRYWMLAVMKKYGMLCELCGDPAITAHHFIPQSISRALRYEVDNGVPICKKHHFDIHVRDDPAPDLLIRADRGEKWYKKILEIRKSDLKIKRNKKTLLADIERLKAR